jgi:alpha(1,3/1,4) fucosyltransferase
MSVAEPAAGAAEIPLRAALEVQRLRQDLPFRPGAGPNGGDWFLPWRQLQQAFAERGVDLHTPDLHADRPLAFELHLNAQRGAGVVPSYCFIYEDPLVRPINDDRALLARYRKVFTWHRGQLQELPNAVRLDYPNELQPRATPGFAGRDLHCVMLASNKALMKPDARSLHERRIATIRAFERLAPQRFTLYGQGWNIPAVRPGLAGRALKRIHEWLSRLAPDRRPFPSWRGRALRKTDILDRARFAITYENSRGSPDYLSEKLFDCLVSGCVPVYIGSAGWQQVVPPDCCIDGDRFDDPAQLVAHLDRVTPAQFEAMQAAGRAFLGDPKTQRFSHDHFCSVIVQTVLADLHALGSTARSNGPR